MVMYTIIDKDGEKHTTVVIMNGATYEHVANTHAFGFEATCCPSIDK